MQKRNKYVALTYSIPPAERQEVLQHCGHCTARLYLEGRAQLAVAPARRLSSKTSLPTSSAAKSSVSRRSAEASNPAEASAASSRASPVKRARTVASCIQELKDLKALLDAGILSSAELEELKAKLLAEC